MYNGELVVDLFAGGGGASCGIQRALGVAPDIAVNHDADAIAMHAANHPDTEHLTEDIFKVNPLEAVQGRPVGLLWASPDCTHHSRARGGKPVKKDIRFLAWAVVHWAQLVRPRVIILENVAEFAEWGPLNKKNRPIKAKKGMTYNLWSNQLRGWSIQHLMLVKGCINLLKRDCRSLLMNLKMKWDMDTIKDKKKKRQKKQESTHLQTFRKIGLN